MIKYLAAMAAFARAGRASNRLDQEEPASGKKPAPRVLRTRAAEGRQTVTGYCRPCQAPGHDRCGLILGCPCYAVVLAELAAELPDGPVDRYQTKIRGHGQPSAVTANSATRVGQCAPGRRLWSHTIVRWRRRGHLPAGAALLVLAMVGCASSAPPQTTAGSATTSPVSPGMPSAIASASATGNAARAGGVPQPAHIVVVVLENHAYSQIIGNPDAPFLNQLADGGALFTHSYAITHPSEPNYLALFSGSTHGVTGDPCPVTFSAPNLASGLLAAGKTFAGYAEDLPAPGSPACDASQYARQLAPWAAFRNVPAAVGQPFARFPAADFSRLPTVSFVIPGLCYDMHNCSVAAGDAWLRTHLGSYANWAMTHDSLLIVTWDEDDFTPVNHIATIFVGQQVRPGRYTQQITHYSVLATIEAAYGLSRDGSAAATAPIDYIWRS